VHERGLGWAGGRRIRCSAEYHAILDENAPDTLAKITAVLETPEVLRAMYAAGFLPDRNDPDAMLTVSMR
jgi:hypothetical protein